MNKQYKDIINIFNYFLTITHDSNFDRLRKNDFFIQILIKYFMIIFIPNSYPTQS